MNIIEELPPELIAIILQYHIPNDLDQFIAIKCINDVLNGQHRPSIIDAHTTIETTTDSYGINRIKYIFNGKLHRENGPAYESYHQNGNIHCREWYINGKCHRENGPAYESYHQNGHIKYRSWYINGKYLRENGPAHKIYYDYGNITYRYWYINGTKFSEEEFNKFNK